MTSDGSQTTTLSGQDYPRIWSTTYSEPIPSVPVMEKGGFWVRSIAYLIDKVVLCIIGLIFFRVSLLAQKTNAYLQDGASDVVLAFILTFLISIVIEASYFTFFYGYSGQTIGKMFCGLKVINTEGELISYRRAFLRWIGYQASFYIFFFGFLWIVIDQNKQGWHDKIAGTFVIKV